MFLLKQKNQRKKNMKDNNLYSKFISLLQEEQIDGSYRVINISPDCAHLIGCSKDGYPILFISTSDNIKTSDIKLELVTVMFNRSCAVHIIDTNEESTNKYSIIQLNSHHTDLQRYFIEVVNLVLLRLGPSPDTTVLKSEIGKVIQLFTVSKPISMEVVRGLWAELLLIYLSKDPDYLINAWHVTPEDKYDFNDGASKVEVKSTTESERKHVFSIDQLNPESGTDLIIASTFVIQTGIGKSVFDLMDMISLSITTDEGLLKLQEVVLTTIGAHIDEVSNYFFDYSRAVSEYKLYDYRDVPTILKKDVPSSVTKVSFQSDLTGVNSIEKETINKDILLHSKL